MRLKVEEKPSQAMNELVGLVLGLRLSSLMMAFEGLSSSVFFDDPE
jgi:hypothetical protein